MSEIAVATKGVSKRAPTASGTGGGFLGTIATGFAKVANFLGEWLPGLVAAPVAGALEILGGFFRLLGGIFTGRGKTAGLGLAEMGYGMLRMIGFKEVIKELVVEKRGKVGGAGGIKMPPTFADDLEYVKTHLPRNACKNGYKAWHAGSNALISQRLGPLPFPFLFPIPVPFALPFPFPIAQYGLFLAGVVHELPLDKQSFRWEQRNQGTVNHILDSLLDLVANVVGQVIGLLLPRRPALAVAMFVGRWLIPGPMDQDTLQGGRGRAYAGNPLDAWLKWKREDCKG